MIPASEINSFQPNFSIYQEPEARKKVSFSALIIRKSDKLSKNTQEELIVISWKLVSKQIRSHHLKEGLIIV